VVLDGYPLAKRGEAGRALGAVLFSSVLGAWLGALALAGSIPVIRPVVLALGPPEFFVLTLLGLAFIATLSGRNLGNGLVMACLGLLVAAVGIDPQSGIPRYVFGQLYLWDGINIVPLVVGLFGGAEVLQTMLSKQSIAGEGADVAKGLSGCGPASPTRCGTGRWWCVRASAASGSAWYRGWAGRWRSSSPTGRRSRAPSTRSCSEKAASRG
jgi:TctA family transporter